VILVGASVLSAGYYLPVVMAMYMKPADRPEVAEGATLAGSARAVVLAAAVVLLLFGVWPNRALDLARTTGEDLRPVGSMFIGSMR
jgi:NADH:ubiquinone oxidoreductase subunit 2 (subunit N)